MPQNKQLHFEFVVTVIDGNGDIVLLDFEHKSQTNASAQTAANAIYASALRQLQLLPSAQTKEDFACQK